jgi:hypothetical protein
MKVNQWDIPYKNSKNERRDLYAAAFILRSNEKKKPQRVEEAPKGI